MLNRLLLFIFTFSFFISAFSAIAVEGKRILIIGDSLTEGYGVAKNKAYPHQLLLLLKKKYKITVVNAGSSGSTSAGAFTRLRWHLRAKPDILILALGGNDGLRGVKPAATKKNLAKTIRLAQKSKILVYLAGMKMPHNYGKDFRLAFEKIYKELIKEYKIKEIPFLLEGVGGRKEFNLPDGIHPNELGHKIIAKNLAKIIEKDL